VQELGEVVAHQAFKLCLPVVGPPQPLLGELLLKCEYFPQLVEFVQLLWHVRLLVKVHHNVRPLVLLPGRVGTPKFVLGAGLRLQRWRAKPLPEDANEHIAVLDA
jgi:hypothetical protein